VLEARERLQDQTRFRALLALVAIAGATLSAGIGTAGADQLTVAFAVMATLLVALAVSGMYLPQAERWKQAERTLTRWKERGSATKEPAREEDVLEDPRLTAARTLVTRIVALGADLDGVDRATSAVDARMRERLADLAVLESSSSADPSPAILEARDRQRAEVDATLSALRSLHAGLVSRSGPGGEPDDLAELVGRLAAEAEVSAVRPDPGDPSREAGIRAARGRVAQ